MNSMGSTYGTYTFKTKLTTFYTFGAELYVKIIIFDAQFVSVAFVPVETHSSAYFLKYL